MHILACSTDRGRTCGLPLHEAAAARLADLWLVERQDRVRPSARDLLCSEPTLAIWAAWRFFEMRGEAATGTMPLAEWFDAEGFAVWRFTSELDLGRRPPSDALIQGWCDLAARSLSIAARAAELAPVRLRDRAYLYGLLHRAEAWCLVAEEGGAELGGIRGTVPAASTADSELVGQAVAEAARQCSENSFTPPTSALAGVERARAGWMSATRHWSCGLDELVHKLRQLRRWETEFHEAVEHEKLMALKEFAYGASHEINNPLANISTRAQTLLQDERDPERRRKLATINSQAFRAHEMISDLMLFARPPMIEPQSVLIHTVVQRVLEELREVAAGQGTRLANLGAELDLVLQADPTYLAVALKSLCMNSLESLGHGGWVEVDVQRVRHRGEDALESEWIEITVRDNGPGISEEMRPHVFDPYFSGREAGRGLGLGLSKCWRIVTLHGGRIQVDSSEQGTTFRLSFPPSSSARPGAEPADEMAGSSRT